jgi:hypothetical protein
MGTPDTLHPDVVEAINQIDAQLFSGALLENEVPFFKGLIYRWGVKVAEWEEIHKEGEPE